MRGAYDVHVHASPSIFERWGDAEQTAQVCQAAGMSGIVLKAHHGSTVEVASNLNGRYEIDVFGGVVLNYFAGGLNPYAVDACCALGGKFVWLPTIHAAAHEPLGRFEFQEPKTCKIPTEGIRITGEKGLAAPLYEILEILHDKKMVLATGHVSTGEIQVLVRAVDTRPYNVRILVNHVHFFSPALDEVAVESLKSENVWFEISHLTHKIQAASIEKTARLIKKHPDAKWVMVSDSGQKDNKAPDALENFRRLLLEQGIDENLLYKMTVTWPEELLY